MSDTAQRSDIAQRSDTGQRPDTTQRLAALSPEKRALLLQRMAKEKNERAAIVPRERPAAIPPSFAQQRLWLLDQLEPGTASYNIPAGAWLHGSVDLDVLRRCLAELVRRHESLRTVFTSVDGAPRQVIVDPYEVALPLHEASGRDAARAIARAEATRGFDLARGPLLRALIVCLAEDEHLLVINVHHVAVDGWSLGIFFRELAALYEAFVEGRPAPFGEPPLQYVDYTLWQREWLEGGVLRTQLDYWTNRLAGAPAVLELPADRPRPAVQSHHGDVVRVSVPGEVVEAARQRSHEEGATLFMTFLAAMQTVLFRYSGQTDIVVGSGIAGRNRQELESIVGYFVNTLPLRNDLSGNPTFRELLGRVRETTLDAYNHQDLPIEKLIEELHVERSLSHTPLFQVMVFFQNLPDTTMRLPGATLSQLPFDELNAATARCDLSVFVEVDETRFDLLLEYSTDLFDAETVRAFGEHLSVLFAAAVANPETRLADLPMLTERERLELLVTRTANRVEIPQVPVTRLIEEQTARTPDAPAIIIGNRTLTYRELDARANAFAGTLRAHGAGPGTLVGIYTDRGPEMVVAVLGVLKSGAAYLPLDPSYPADRIAFMIEDSGARLVVTQEHLRNEVPAKHAELVIVDCSSVAPPTSAEGQNAAEVGGATLNDVAYVIYTSGSTGKPKGVQIPHAGALNFLLAMQREPGLTADDTICAITTLSFDISVLELLLPLITGAKAVIGDRATATDGKRLARFIADSGATLVQATPASWRMLLDAGWTGDPKLKLLCGGEPMPRDLADALLDRCGGLWNVYGPTETTVWSVLDRITRNGAITVGRPIHNMRMYVADANMQLAPDGVPGELMIGGIGLGHAYVNRPSLTADRFIPDPFSGVPGARIYRSGDIARWRRDGRIEILGRSDNQIKLRGFRIELGEIEGTLREHAGVRQGVVLCREDRPGDKRLVAYVVPESPSVTAGDLRAHLKAGLPEYMVPSAFVLMEKLPISPNGKVDRRALPAPDLSDIAPTTFAPPRTPEEQQLAGIWAEVLGLGQIGIHDDFFALGGHSLLATQLIARVSRAFGMDIPLRRLFEAPTIAGFAETILQRETNDRAGITRRERPAVIPPSFGQQRLWLLDQLEQGSASYNIPVGAWLEGHVDREALRRTLDELVRRHEALRTVFPAEGGAPRQMVTEPYPVALPLFEAADRAAAVAIAREEAARPFDLAHGPLTRALIVRIADDEHLLVINFHHAVMDGWSLGIVFRELAALYEAFLHGRAPALPEPQLQYVDYALWQREWLQGETLQKQLDYWTERLAGAPSVLELPSDRPRPSVRSHRGDIVRVSAPGGLVAAVQQRSQEEGVTFFMTFLAAMQTVLFRYSGQTDVVVGAGIAGRVRQELEATVGYFVNTLPLRADLSGNPTFRELLGRVRETTLSDYEHQDLPIERLIEELHVERSLSHAPLFQVMLFFQNFGDRTMRLPGATLVQLEMDELNPGSARCDLALFVEPQDARLDLVLEYSTDLFDAETVRAFGEHFAVLLAAAVANPETRIADLPMLTGRERHELLVARTANRAEIPQVPLTRLIEEQTARTPDAPAIVAGDRMLTYGELDARATAFARTLRARGAKTGTPVGIYTDRGAEMMVAVLGVLKSGAAYLPLDPSYPADRIAFMIEDSGAPLVVTQEHLRKEVPSAHAELVIVDCSSVTPPTSAEGQDAVDVGGATSTDLAYVIYTSGSTGKPKGVQIPHAGVVNFLLSMQREPGLTAGDTVCAITTLSFDISILELLLPLITGAKVVIADRATASDGRRLARLLAESGATVVQATPASWRMLLDAGWTGDPALKLLCGGESMSRDLADALLDRCAELWNVYGPTEASIWMALERVTREGAITIGRPIRNMRMYVADANLQLTPDGVPGELLIGGVGLGYGYVNRPRLTAEKFIADPFSGDPSARLYRSGDVARWRRDGRMEILGRSDHQIKLRGFRVELGEIEGALGEHAGVRQAVVICREDRPGDRRLVAYVVTGSPAVSAQDLRAHLRTALPEYMLPSAFVMMEKLPVSGAGKIDRRALPAPDLSDLAPTTFAPPRTPEEEQLAGIWTQVLGIGQIGIHDDFFALGGHSLLATQLIARVSREFGADIPVRRLFEAPTIAGFAETLMTDLMQRVEQLSDAEIEALLAAEGHA